MKQEKYDFKIAPTDSVYEFVSIGNKGGVKKLVVFSIIEPPFYNLGFVDIDPKTGEQSDLITTNNGDSQKVLATVAATVLHFTNDRPDVWVFASGSTPARTRLYRMGIANNLTDIEQFFEVLGLTDEGWQVFELGTTYKAFLVKRKNIQL